MCRERERFGEFLLDEVKFLIKLIVHGLASIVLAVAAIFAFSHQAAPNHDIPECRCSRPDKIPPKTPHKRLHKTRRK